MEPQPTLAEIVRLLRPGGVFAWFNTLEPIVTPWKADQAYLRFRDWVQTLEKERRATRPPLRSSKEEYFQRMEASFRHTRQFHLHQVALWDAQHLIGLAESRSDIQNLFRMGVSQAEIGLDSFGTEIRQIMGEQPRPWYWSWEGGLGIK
jgi:hypothetical protein